MTGRVFYLPLNPEPWTTSEASVGRRGNRPVVNFFKPAGLDAYQQAVKEEMELLYPDAHELKANPEPYGLRFFFWRQVDAYTTGIKKGHRNYADATNLQKALEDALQGILYMNDRANLHVSSTIVSQGPDADPGILILVAPLPVVEIQWAESQRRRIAPTQQKANPTDGRQPDRDYDDNLF